MKTKKTHRLKHTFLSISIFIANVLLGQASIQNKEIKVKKLLGLNLILFLACSYLMAQQTTSEFPILIGQYFGQKPPRYIPEVFMPGIISANGMWKHSPMAFSPDGTEAYWSVANPLTIYFVKLENNQWTRPEIAPFAKGLECSSPVFAPDGKKLFFASQIVENREDAKNRKFHIWLWFVEKENSCWSKPKAVDAIINTGKTDYQVSFSNDGTLYFSAIVEDNKNDSDIFYSKFVNGQYTQPVNIGDSINSAARETRVFVAPDESYILFARMVPVKRIMGQYSDFYISYRNTDGSWTKPEEIGDMLGEKTTSSWINVSPDGKYIFYTSLFPGRASNIYWTSSATIIDYFMPYECLVPGTIEEAVIRYKKIQKSVPQSRTINENRLVAIGYNFLNKDKTTEAITIFKIITELYPQSWNAFDCLGEAYAKSGKEELAIENYEKSLKLKPDNKNGIDAIKRLRGK